MTPACSGDPGHLLESLPTTAFSASSERPQTSADPLLASAVYSLLDTRDEDGHAGAWVADVTSADNHWLSVKYNAHVTYKQTSKYNNPFTIDCRLDNIMLAPVLLTLFIGDMYQLCDVLL